MIPTREEDVRLSRLAQAGDTAARDALVTGHMRFVIWVARRYRCCGIPLDDLVNEGVLGMIRAVEKFDPDRGVKLTTYAYYWVKQAIQRAIAKQARLVRVPEGNSEARARVTSLDAPLPESDNRLGDLLGNLRGPSPVDAVHDSMMAETIERALGQLRPREAQIVRLRYGLADGYEYTLQEIGRIFRVTRERVRQIHLRALERLRLPGRLPAA